MISGALTPSTATLSLVSRLKQITADETQHIENAPLFHQYQPQSAPSPTSSTSSAATATMPIEAAISVPDKVRPAVTNNDPPTAAVATANTTQANGSGGRSAALERAYVHDVYENCDEPVGSIRPKVAQFLAGLDPGSMVCDVGCGTGRYLNACNPLIYAMGVDRCYRLANATREKGGEVALCDNLELPFRDESFDAVLSVAVVHHFATTDRRVGAIRELARIMRIGGRVIITVWALEQKQRRFESQDVLIPWQQPKSRNSNFSDEEDDDDYLPPYHAYTGEDSTNSSRSAGDGDSSSLSSSSPGESCYSFVRRAIQKLAGGGGKRHPWFLDNWNSKDTKNGSSLDYEDAKDLPIELRRLEDFEDFPEPPLSAGLKSRSLGSILYPPPSRQIVRSRSSVPSLGGAHIPENVAVQCSSSYNHTTVVTSSTYGASTMSTSVESRRPRLVKQKQSLCEDDFPASSEEPLNATSPSSRDTRQLLRKQSSLNEELMAENRIREREKVKKRIQKQMSLNESYLSRSTVFSRKLQIIRDGLTTKLKTSTGSLERVTKSGLVKIMQNIKSSTTAGHCSKSSEHSTKDLNRSLSKDGPPVATANGNVSSPSVLTTEEEQKERRHSRESGSDSSKDSLQSDTSIESEDSFASVIFIPKPEHQQLNNESTACTTTRTPSVPTSPLVMPCPPTPAHSPAPPRCKVQQQTTLPEATRFPFENLQLQKTDPDTENHSTLKSPPQPVSRTRTPSLPVSPPKKLSEAKPQPMPKAERITKQVVKNLPQIPKFRKHFSVNYPIVRRTTTAPSVPKLSSMEIFNPETDDLDSDSSEPSSPDSIDSVISAFKPAQTTSTSSTNDVSSTTEKSKSPDKSSPSDQEPTESTPTRDTVQLNPIGASSKEPQTDSNVRLKKKGDSHLSRQDMVAFAEKLNAQLLKEMDNSQKETDDMSALIASDPDDETGCEAEVNHGESEYPFRFEDPYIRKLNGELKDLNSLREELRERRLMLANLNVQHYQSSSTIHEEDESPRDEVDNASEMCANNSSTGSAHFNHQLHRPIQRMASVDAEPCSEDIASIINSTDNLHVLGPVEGLSSDLRRAAAAAAASEIPIAISNDLLTAGMSVRDADASAPHHHQPHLESKPSVESWAHSNSTASLDSPSAGGSSTHHRYYHVFREGELDALINHHVTSLHIVSSYYERASWCVVAEKVQVWTI